MPFVIPLQTQVEEYMKERKWFPESFCQYYANRFWNHYQASGWKLSSGNAMKDWKAAVNSTWHTLKFKEDIDYLQKCLKENGKMSVGQALTGNEIQDTLNYLDEVLNQYKRRFETVTTERLSGCYDWLKAQGLMKLSPEEIRPIKEAYSDDPLKGKAACVSTLFQKMINNGITFNSLKG